MPLDSDNLKKHKEFANDIIKSVAKISNYKGSVEDLLKAHDVAGSNSDEIKASILTKIINSSTTIHDQISKNEKAANG